MAAPCPWIPEGRPWDYLRLYDYTVHPCVYAREAPCHILGVNLLSARKSSINGDHFFFFLPNDTRVDCLHSRAVCLYGYAVRVASRATPTHHSFTCYDIFSLLLWTPRNNVKCRKLHQPQEVGTDRKRKSNERGSNSDAKRLGNRFCRRRELHGRHCLGPL